MFANCCYTKNENEADYECGICLTKSDSTLITENFIVQALDANRKNIIRCGVDECSGVATVHCVECNDNLCAECRNAHLRVKFTKRHQLNPIANNQSMAVISKCHAHPEENLTHFCNECKILTCRDCQLSSDHTGHRAVQLSEEAITQKANLPAFVNSVQQKMNALKKQEELIDGRLQNLDNLKETSQRNLTETRDQLCSAIVKRIEELSKAVDQAYDKKQKNYADVKKPLAISIEMTKQAKNVSAILKSLDNDVVLLRSMKYINNYLELISNTHPSCDMNVVRLKDQPIDLALPIGEILESISTFGTVKEKSDEVHSIDLRVAAINPGSAKKRGRPKKTPPIVSRPNSQGNKSASQLLAHRKLEKIRKDRPTNVRIFQCRKYAQKFGKSNKIVCRLCEKSLLATKPQRLTHHVLTIHLKKPIYVCQRCKTPSTNYNQLWRHLKSEHNTTTSIGEYKNRSNDFHHEIMGKLAECFDWSQQKRTQQNRSNSGIDDGGETSGMQRGQAMGASDEEED